MRCIIFCRSTKRVYEKGLRKGSTKRVYEKGLRQGLRKGLRHVFEKTTNNKKQTKTILRRFILHKMPKQYCEYVFADAFF
jgi:hypothetical protein